MIFSSPTSGLSIFGKSLEFNHLQTPDLIVDHNYSMFTTILHKPSYFVMGLASSTGGVSLLSPLSVVPLRCSLYVEYPVDSNDYITGSDVRVWVTLNLKTVELVSIIIGGLWFIIIHLHVKLKSVYYSVDT